MLHTFIFQLVLQPNTGCGLLTLQVFANTCTLDLPQSVGILWTSDQFVAETST
jgi:hypothetical protein